MHSGLLKWRCRSPCGAGCGYTFLTRRSAAEKLPLMWRETRSPVGKSAKICLAKNYGSVIIREIYEKHLLFPEAGRGWLIALITAASFSLLPVISPSSRRPQQRRQLSSRPRRVPSAYGAPPVFSRSRFSNTVNAYVLPPWAFFFGELFEGQGFRHGPPDYLFTQEIEMGLPYRFNVAAETELERFNGGGGAQTVSLEARWALADWNKIPLNPTIFAEYKFGVGTIRHEEVPPPPGEGGEAEEEEEGGPPKVPDAYEVRLLLAQEFFDRVEWAMNWFFEKENTGDRGREWGFSQAAMIPVLLPNERLKVGIEMEYKNVTTQRYARRCREQLRHRPNRRVETDHANSPGHLTIIWLHHDSPVADVFVAFSWLFGGERAEAEAPYPSRFRYLSEFPRVTVRILEKK